MDKNKGFYGEEFEKHLGFGSFELSDTGLGNGTGFGVPSGAGNIYGDGYGEQNTFSAFEMRNDAKGMSCEAYLDNKFPSKNGGRAGHDGTGYGNPVGTYNEDLEIPEALLADNVVFGENPSPICPVRGVIVGAPVIETKNTETLNGIWDKEFERAYSRPPVGSPSKSTPSLARETEVAYLD